jgi:hypothetical protein
MELKASLSGLQESTISLYPEVGLERGPLSFEMIIEELFQGNSSSGIENRN